MGGAGVTCPRTGMARAHGSASGGKLPSGELGKAPVPSCSRSSSSLLNRGLSAATRAGSSVARGAEADGLLGSFNAAEARFPQSVSALSGSSRSPQSALMSNSAERSSDGPLGALSSPSPTRFRVPQLPLARCRARLPSATQRSASESNAGGRDAPNRVSSTQRIAWEWIPRGVAARHPVLDCGGSPHRSLPCRKFAQGRQRRSNRLWSLLWTYFAAATGGSVKPTLSIQISKVGSVPTSICN
jgi:hypothetical protein